MFFQEWLFWGLSGMCGVSFGELDVGCQVFKFDVVVDMVFVIKYWYVQFVEVKVIIVFLVYYF